MSFLNDIHRELKQEAAVTRRHLARVPFEQRAFKPHEKSETIGRLAIHVAEIVAWWKACLQYRKLDFLGFSPEPIASTQELLTYFDELLSVSEQAIVNASDEVLTQPWSMTYGGQVLFTLPKQEGLRKFCLNHLIRHRAQLGVYLRLLNAPVPAVYGPSADDKAVTLTDSFL